MTDEELNARFAQMADAVGRVADTSARNAEASAQGFQRVERAQLRFQEQLGDLAGVVRQVIARRLCIREVWDWYNRGDLPYGLAMHCPLCGHPKVYKHGKMPNGHQRFRCLLCKQTFSETFDTLFYHRQVSPEQVQLVLQSHSEGCSLRGISRLSGLAYNTVVSLIRSASHRAQLIHNQEVNQVDTDAVDADEMWSFVEKNRKIASQRKSRKEIAGSP